MDQLFFYAFSIVILVSALLCVTAKNAVHSAIFLIGTLLGVAGLYLHLNAEFLAGVQVILYVGGIMVLFLFVIMLVNLDQMAKERQFNRGWMVGLAAVAAVGVEIGYFFYRGQDSFKLPDVAPPPVSLGNTEVLADVLFRQYLLPFEIASILLLVAVVGSVVMAKKRI